MTYVACAPKSNAACCAIQDAMEAVKTERAMPVPVHLQDRHYKGAGALGHGDAISTPMIIPSIMYASSICLMHGGPYLYRPSDNGYETQMKAHMEWLKN